METFIRLFASNVDRYGRKTAIVDMDGKREMSYESLDRLSSQVAAALVQRGIKKEDKIPVLLPRGREYIAAEIGVLKAGAAFVGLDMAYPEERVAFIQKDCDCAFVIDEVFINEAQNSGPMLQVVETSESDAAFAVYTSGSTGNPKGIIHEHKSLLSGIQRYQIAFDMTREDVHASVVSFSFVAVIFDVFLPLAVGATVHILSDSLRKDVLQIEAYLTDHLITTCMLSPQMLKNYSNRSESLRAVITGSERVSSVMGQGYRLCSTYGSSETVAGVTMFNVDQAYENTPIGKPFPGYSIILLDEAGNPVKDGEEGEICVAGIVARGYINLPELTARTFTPNPFATGENDQVMFHTGDIGRFLPDGNLLYVNRKDWMVKINGQRVEPGEIEAVMTRLPQVETAVVKAFENDYGQTYLCGYFKELESITEDEVRAALVQKLPAYMVPLFILKLDQFPVNQNGKLDRKSLMPPAASYYKRDYVAPENELQQLICRGFAEILQVSPIGLDDDFFALGGDSIKAVMLQGLCGEIGLRAEEIFKGRTPREIALLCEGSTRDIYDGCYEELPFYKMTDSQMGVYLECSQNLAGTMYNIPAYCVFPRKLNLDIIRFKASVEKVVDGYPFMKVRTDLHEGTPVMVPDPALHYEIPIEQAREKEMGDKRKAFVTPFNLQTGPLFRFAIFETEPSVHFLLDFHHIIADGASVSVFLDRVAKVYQGGEPEPEEISSFVLTNYEAKMKESAAYQESRQYFANLLAGNEVDSNLIYDKEEDKYLENKPCKRLALSLNERIGTQAAMHFLQPLGLTENTLFLGAFAYALAKFTGQDESLFCTVNNGRHNARLKNTMGMLVRTLPVYTKFDEEVSVGDYLQGIQNDFFATMRYDCCSFEEMAASYGIKSDILYVYQGETLNGFTFGNAMIELQTIETNSSLANLVLMVFRRGGTYELSFEYRTDIYEETTIRRFGEMILGILAGFMQKSTLKEIPLASDEDVRRWAAFNDNSLLYDRSQTIVDMFRQQAKETPERSAVVYQGKILTYRELDDLSERLAIYLSSKGVRAEMPVGIMIKRSELMPVCSLGVLKAGGAYQPLDPTYPQERLSYMLRDSGAGILIVDEDLMGIIPDFQGEVIYTKELASLPLDQTVHLAGPKAEDLFILLYTSGSTGMPKGCMLEHRNIVNFCLAFQEKYDVTLEDISAAYASFGFDASMMDFYPYLTKGACVHVIPEEMRLDLAGIDRYFREHRVSLAFLTTQLGCQYVTEYGDNPYLKAFLTGGEKMVPCDPPSFRFYNVYGPTEGSIFMTSFTVDKKYATVPIGHSFGNCDVYIVDKYHRALPVGVPGELCIAGYPVSRGYLHREDLTNKVFVPNPFSDKAGYERMYKTGDICRFLSDGTVEYTGRRDFQVKIRGFRVELTEIEARIRQYDGIKAATVIAREAAGGGKIVVAYIVGEEPIDINKMNDFIMEELPPYMVPAATMQIETIPLNQNGKVDKKRLPEIQFTAEQEEASPRPLTLFEKELTEMVGAILGHKDFGITSNLLRAGLSSLSAIKLATAISKEYGYAPNVKKMMRECTILSLEDELQQHLLANRAGAMQGETRDQNSKLDYYPLSQSQLGVYYDCMKRPEEIIYNIPIMLSLSKNVDTNRLVDAVKAVIKAHPYLSTHLKMVGEEIMQIRDASPEPAIEFLSMQEEKLLTFKEDFLRPFRLFKGPLYRLVVVKTEKATYLLCDFHHIIFDGGSFDIFLAELKQVYEGQAPELEDYSYFDYVEDEQREEQGEAYQEAEAYFEARLENFAGASEVSADLQGKAEEGFLAESVYPVEPDRVNAFCQARGITPAHLFLAGTFYTVSRWINSPEVYISTISNGRTNIKIQNSLGMFVKTLPLSCHISDDQTAFALIEETRQTLIDTISYEAYPFTRLAAKYGFAPQIMYACQLGVLNEFTLGGETVGQEGLELNIPKFKISVHIEERDSKIAICVQYNDALYSKAAMDGFTEALAVSVEQMISTPERKLGQISLLSKNQAARLDGFHQAGTCELEEKILHKVFEKQAARHPDKKALIAVDGEFTFTELDAAMNRVANALIDYGVKPGDQVVMLLPRTSRMLVTMYGILKAGGAFIPCDPEYPIERINYVLADSDAAYIITTAERVGDFPAGRAVDVEKLMVWPDERAPQVQVRPTDLAYLIYTSGSTGTPKGVMLEHQGICNYVYNHEANIHVRAAVEDAHVMLSVTTVSFDMSLKETAVALCNGMTLVLASEEEANNPILLARLFERTGADAFNATPSRMLQYMELPALGTALQKCSVIMAGGEKYPLQLLQKLKSITKARIFNTYGPTEITVSSNAKELTDEEEINIGRPLLNYEEFIVDSAGNELPVGVVGELYIGGIGVARGYCNLEEMTAERFVDYKGKRVYKSGDYAMWTRRGDVVLLGRTDNQIKLRGLRIELGEIESNLTSYPGVKNAVVTIRKIQQTEHICAYYTAEEPILVEDIKEYLKKRLTAYMVPTAYLQMEALPVTLNGKTDLKALPEPVLAAAGEYVPPAGEAENIFCDIFAHVLGLPQVGTTDNFFDLGGTSLVVTRVIIAATEYNFEISYGDVFSYPTPRELAAVLSSTNPEQGERLEDLSRYAYEKLEPVLQANTLASFQQGKAQPLGNILLTGATGFLGIHILEELLRTQEGMVYCLLRDKKTSSAEKRLKAMLYYYFERNYEELFGKRIFVINGDVTKSESFDQMDELSIDVVINCAANVKHFSKGTDIEDVNLGGVINIIDFCMRNSCRLVHVSTTSVAGFSVGDVPAPETVMNEQMLYFGQSLDTKYGHSKFLAERAILEKVSEGLSAKIMRVGNLSARERDGEFQINSTTNSFMGRLKSYLLIGKFPYAMMDQTIEMTSIDSTAHSILLLAHTPRECCVFHPYNNHSVTMGDIIQQFNEMGMSIEVTETEDYEKALAKAQADPEKAKVLSSMIAYQNMGHGKKVAVITKENVYTSQVLYRLGYHWPILSREYMERFIFALRGLGFFDLEEV